MSILQQETKTKIMKCSEEKDNLKAQLEKLQGEVQSLKEEDQKKVQNKKEEELENEKKLKEMTTTHELKVSKLKGEHDCFFPSNGFPLHSTIWI